MVLRVEIIVEYNNYTILINLLIVMFLKAILLSILVAMVIRKANVQSVDELDLRVISDVNKEYGIKESR